MPSQLARELLLDVSDKYICVPPAPNLPTLSISGSHPSSFYISVPFSMILQSSCWLCIGDRDLLNGIGGVTSSNSAFNRSWPLQSQPWCSSIGHFLREFFPMLTLRHYVICKHSEVFFLCVFSGDCPYVTMMCFPQKPVPWFTFSYLPLHILHTQTKSYSLHCFVIYEAEFI